ncbi:hypothetical protein N7461_005090 [Penicillium sp. DV-2018c]|nr:hypothetical protein N7461_005090 [Penicillium sp. DV-2018c]
MDSQPSLDTKGNNDISRQHGEGAHPGKSVENSQAPSNSRLTPRPARTPARTLPPPFIPQSHRSGVHPLAPSPTPPSTSMSPHHVALPQSHTPGPYHGSQYLDPHAQAIGPAQMVYSPSRYVSPRQFGPAAYDPQFGVLQYGAPYYGAPHYGASQYGALRYGTPPYGATQQYGATVYGTAQCGAAQYGAVQYGATQYDAAQYGAAQYGAAQYGASQYGAGQYISPEYGYSQSRPPQLGSSQLETPQSGAPQPGIQQHGPQQLENCHNLIEQTRTSPAPQAEAPTVQLSQIEPRAVGPSPLSPDPLAPSPPPADPPHGLRPPPPSAPSINPQHTSPLLPTGPAPNGPVLPSVSSSLSASSQQVLPKALPGIAATHPLPDDFPSAPSGSPQHGLPSAPPDPTPSRPSPSRSQFSHSSGLDRRPPIVPTGPAATHALPFPSAIPADPGSGTPPVPTGSKRGSRSRLPSAPPISQQRLSPPRGPGSNGLDSFGRLQSTVGEGGPGSFPTATALDPDDIFRTATRPCHVANRRYMNWIRVTYCPSISPEGFMRNWHHALGEVRMAFGLLSIPDIFVFNQFLCAVSANPAAREWVASLHLPMDRPPAASIMEETYRDFLKHESRRLGLPLGTSDSQNARTKTTPTAGGTLKHHCPLQHILTEHSKEECLLLSISANEKSNENKVENTKVENKKNAGRRDWRRKKMIFRHEGFSFPGRL